MREPEETRKPGYDQSERRIGITKEVWYLAHTPAGDQSVAYMKPSDFARALSLFSESRDECDLWFKQRVADVMGIALNDPPAIGPPQMLRRSTTECHPERFGKERR